MKPRLEDLRKVRNLNELWTIVKGIASDINARKRKVRNLEISLSDSETDLVIDHRDGKLAAPTKTADGYLLTNYSLPRGMKELARNNDIVTGLMENIEELDTSLAIIKQSFSSQKKAPVAIKAIEALRTDALNQLDKALEVLGNTAEGHMPSFMRQLGDKIQNTLIEDLDGSIYDGMYTQLYAVPTSSGSDTAQSAGLDFSYYIELENLKNQENYVFPAYFIVLTGRVDENGLIRFYINALDEFKAPGRYPIGKQITGLTDAVHEVGHLLAFNHFVTDFERKPLPFDSVRIKSSGLNKLKYVADVDIENDVFKVRLQKSCKTDAQVSSVAEEILARLNSLAGGKARTSIARYKVRTETSATLTFKVPKAIDASLLEKLRGVQFASYDPKSKSVTVQITTSIKSPSAKALVMSSVESTLSKLVGRKIAAPSNTEETNRYLDFVFVQRLGKTALTAGQLDDIAREFNMTQQEVKALRFALQGRR